MRCKRDFNIALNIKRENWVSSIFHLLDRRGKESSIPEEITDIFISNKKGYTLSSGNRDCHSNTGCIKWLLECWEWEGVLHLLFIFLSGNWLVRHTRLVAKKHRDIHVGFSKRRVIHFKMPFRASSGLLERWQQQRRRLPAISLWHQADKKALFRFFIALMMNCHKCLHHCSAAPPRFAFGGPEGL